MRTSEDSSSVQGETEHIRILHLEEAKADAELIAVGRAIQN